MRSPADSFFLKLIGVGFLSVTIGTLSFSSARASEQANPSPSPETIRRLAESDLWRKLLHFRPSITGSVRSEVDDPAFFFAGVERGKLDPLAELLATVERFRAPAETIWGRIRQHPLCAFPARREFLERNGFAFPDQPCRDFREWEAGIGAKSVALVYSSSYPGNPASLFGHTFLRFDRDANHERGLLSYGANFAALSNPDDSSFTYAMKGLFGGYQGIYGISPYYLKVNEYTHSESRDLWEYELGIPPERVSTLLKHLWELYGNSSFDYFFLDENCSYQILTALEVAMPEWKLANGFHLYVLPIESVLRVSKIEGAVTGVRYRPSNRRQLLNAYQSLPSEGRSRVRALTRGDLSALEQAGAAELDATILYYSLRKSRDQGQLSAEDSARMRGVLLARSKLGKIARDDDVAHAFRDRLSHSGPGPVRADRFHLTARAAAAYGDSRTYGRFARYSFSGFHHDYLNDDAGFDPFSVVRVGSFDFEREIDRGRFRFRAFEAIAMDSLYPYQAIDPKKSWSIRAAIERPWETGCDGCVALRGGGGFGSGVELFSPRTLLFGLGTAELQMSGRFEKSFRLSPGVRGGIVSQPIATWPFRLQALGRSQWDVFENESLPRASRELELGAAFFLGQQFDLRLIREWRVSGAVRDARSRVEASVFF